MLSAPGKSGAPKQSSTATQASEKTSMAGQYSLVPSRFQGARYHLVATQSVDILWVGIANPKSMSLISAEVLSMRMFSGLTSRWMMPRQWTQASPKAVWNRMHFTCSSRSPYLCSSQSSRVFWGRYSRAMRVSPELRSCSKSKTLTMLGCSKVLRRQASLRAMFWCVFMTLRAVIWAEWCCLAVQTVLKLPLPTFSKISYLLFICILFLIAAQQPQFNRFHPTPPQTLQPLFHTIFTSLPPITPARSRWFSPLTHLLQIRQSASVATPGDLYYSG